VPSLFVSLLQQQQQQQQQHEYLDLGDCVVSLACAQLAFNAAALAAAQAKQLNSEWSRCVADRQIRQAYCRPARASQRLEAVSYMALYGFELALIQLLPGIMGYMCSISCGLGLPAVGMQTDEQGSVVLGLTACTYASFTFWHQYFSGTSTF
jgi:hypothetical protein